MALTPRQKQVLDFIAGFVEEHAYCPSYEEIAGGLDLASLATVHKHITALESKKYLRRSFNQSRSLELAPRYFEETRRRGAPAPASLEVPLEGRIAAGTPVEAFSGRETVNFADFAGDRDTYALEVSGESMIEDHICSGDYVLVERTTEVRNGDIVVALVCGSETTLKRIYREGDSIRLQPANSAMEPIRVPASDVNVQGRVLAVLRKYR
ncbi:MAG: transcriptional repressor LexA [Acidimicrobiia bacterium]|nr:transcriptional repressor LexA [Acidimicrobiia bacterium]